MSFVGVHSSYAQYPDAKSLLGRLGVKIDKDGKPVADGSGGFLPKVYDDFLMRQEREGRLKLTYLCEGAVSCPASDSRGSDCSGSLGIIPGIVPDSAGLVEFFDWVRSREFLGCVFGESFVSAFPEETDVMCKGDDVAVNVSIEFPKYDSLCKSRRTCSVELREYEFHNEAYLSFCEKEMKPCVAAFEALLTRHVPANHLWKDLWKVWDAFRRSVSSKDPKDICNAEDDSARKRGYGFSHYSDHPLLMSFVEGVRCAENNFLKTLEVVYDLPLRIAFQKVHDLLPKFLQLFVKAFYTYGSMKVDEYSRKEYANKEISEYKSCFADRDRKVECNGQSWSISTENPTIAIRIFHYHYEGEDGTRKLYTEKWEKRVTDLNITLRLVVDSRTKQLRAAFCCRQFVVDRWIADFGEEGLCVFKSKQP